MNRNQLIKLIHVAKRDRKLDDDTYRQFLVNYAGVNSTRDMTERQLQQVLDAMKQLGFKVKSTKPNKITATDAQSKKIRALWLEMSDAGYVRDSSERAINAYVHRITEVGRLEWLSTDQASRVIESLKQWQARERKAQSVQ
ncbi:regulatory protein GemA [Pectobacterium sp. A535-S3-A17]|uniref:gp16 family protein n=1 Tax=Pectobacterium TaxID=122277 RepID=UPI0018761832|nr:regulatory protein GemA [Pectobacterium quasiaquaticum]MBE5226739.1 regulatory protein GemA [Pectobacterium quasiaquaticum]